MSNLHLLSLTQIAAGLEAGDFSAVDVTKSLLARINGSGESLNAFITVTAEQALTSAASADAARAAGNGGTLNGLPLVHKDIFCTRCYDKLRFAHA